MSGSKEELLFHSRGDLKVVDWRRASPWSLLPSPLLLHFLPNVTVLHWEAHRMTFRVFGYYKMPTHFSVLRGVR